MIYNSVIQLAKVKKIKAKHDTTTLYHSEDVYIRMHVDLRMMIVKVKKT